MQIFSNYGIYNLSSQQVINICVLVIIYRPRRDNDVHLMLNLSYTAT